MKPRHTNKRVTALTLIEVLVVVGVLALLVALLVPNNKAKTPGIQMNCGMNLMQVGLSFRQWAADNNDKLPMQVSVTNGGTMELVNGGIVYPHFQVMSNWLSNPRILVCPEDVARKAATNFTTDFNDLHISYLVGVDADQDKPTMFLAGDANLDVGGEPAKQGLLTLWTNSSVTWIKRRHKGGGNILFADGHVERVNTERLRQALTETGVATNRLAIP